MKLFIFSASLIYLLGLKMSTKLEFQTHSSSEKTATETVIQTPDKKTGASENNPLLIKTDSLVTIKSTSNAQTAPTEKSHKKPI